MTHLIGPCECHSCFGPLALERHFPHIFKMLMIVILYWKETTSIILEHALGHFVELPEDIFKWTWKKKC